MKKEITSLQKARYAYKPKLPTALQNGAHVAITVGDKTTSVADSDKIHELFPATYGAPTLTFTKGDAKTTSPINVGVILSGGQAPGGHNVISGIFDGIKSIHPESKLFGFLGGPSGVIENKYIELTLDIIDAYRNTGGFDIIQSGRTKLETVEHFDATASNCKALGIKALVIIGGDDSNTNAALLAEYFADTNKGVNVIGCPKTIDGDLKNEHIETSFGFDTACKVYSNMIGNIQRDAMSAQKYWHFVKLMGRSASHIGLECALQTQPNITLISEEVEANQMQLKDVVNHMADIIVKRAEKKMNFGIALIPEGLVEFIPEFKILIQELNDILAHHEVAFQDLRSYDEQKMFLNKHLTEHSSYLFNMLPVGIQTQLILERDPHGNVPVSMIETEKLLIELIKVRLEELKEEGKYNGKFSAINHFFGYEGRCAAPSNFDADYCYSLGFNAAALIGAGKTGYMSSIRNISKPQNAWIAGGIPITMMMNVERRHGHDKPVIRKALVELDGAPFKYFANLRAEWAIGNHYLYAGPIQYFGPAEVADIVTRTLELEQAGK
ncbi:MAG: diphosphate--fructose-6-phosphate 1-phosphotransferase [Fusobacteria bacterium]|nr:diphosphate--fructose-6-phosphate 1-phosphotransferase [Fusobacteriota bacterium]